MEQFFVGWNISFGTYGKATPVSLQYITWTEYCEQRGWNAKELKRKKTDGIRSDNNKR